jgi:hypothetical protein
MLTGFEEQRAGLNIEPERFGTHFLLHAGQVPQSLNYSPGGVIASEKPGGERMR